MPDGSNFVIAAYAALWIGVLAYAWRLVGVTRRAQARLSQVRSGHEGEAEDGQ